MSEFVRICSASEVPAEGYVGEFSIKGRPLCVANVNGAIAVLDGVCPHQGGPLAEGSIEGSIVTCPWHAWCFDVRTGKMTLGEFAYVEVFDVEVRDSAILVSLDPRA